MKHAWLRREPGMETVYVVALGWGQDEASLDDFTGESDGDIVTLFAWNEPGELPELAAYRRRVLIAWSFGVWSAARLSVAWDAAVAVNGTLTPVDDWCGIPEAVFAATLDGWRDGVTEKKFWRRMGARPGDLPLRSPAALRSELEYFQTQFAACPVPANCYQLAVIGKQDRIFPPESQRNAWHALGTAMMEMDWPHDFRGAAGAWMEVAKLGCDR